MHIHSDIHNVGSHWLTSEVNQWPDEVIRVTPSEYSEQHRYLPASVSRMPGYIRWDLTPYLREIVDCFDIESEVREVNVRKGVQIGYTTVLESGLLYFIGHVRSLPGMFVTADKELAQIRIENNMLPMLIHSGFKDLIRSSDPSSKRKTGLTKDYIQWDGGGYLLPFGIKNPDKARTFSIAWLFKDELDAWPEYIGRDGDPDAITDDRAAEYWDIRKIFRGSTPLIRGASKIDDAFERGDARHYYFICESCGYKQTIRWSGKNEKTGHEYGFFWDLESGMLLPDSVRYRCQNCPKEYHDKDKARIFSERNGAGWVPTKSPAEPGIRSYQLPALYSILRPWSKSVALYLDAYDPENRRVRNLGKFQAFYNNVLGRSFEIKGSRIKFEQVFEHRRTEYQYGQVPNEYAIVTTGYPISLVAMEVDVHKSFLAVSVFGYTRGMRGFLIDYWHLRDDDGDGCTREESPVWAELTDKIDNLTYTSIDGRTYPIGLTVIDARYQNDLVVSFCARFEHGVIPILGRDRPAHSQTVKEFGKWTTPLGTVGYHVTVDHYKDRLAPVLRREWRPEHGPQPEHHWNAPVDITKAQLEELTKETRVKKVDDKGRVSYAWHRPGNARNELWDLSVYGYAAVEILAYEICTQHFELENVDWDNFWDYLEENELYFSTE